MGITELENCAFESNIKNNECGLKIREYQVELGNKMWRLLYEKYKEKYKDGEDRPLITQWRMQPGRIYNSFNYFDALFPDVFLASSPPIYPRYSINHPGQIAPMIRRILLGVLSLAGENLVNNGSVEGDVKSNRCASWIYIYR